ncbi:thiamine pyrophosphate-dependent enzyme [Mesorhizobium japonicum]|uniref:thiamine pyrophosphate-dependent enzyme n=1 Tax=Mesorhizobium japonicum TaxID=2066070 RepID=UPI002484A263|nr:thiamine pyrophosphate-dependent enzyme [Mesorhizobium japonicum]
MRLFKAGRIPGAFHASIGQEAAIVGACLSLRQDDAMTGTHRSHGHPIGKGGRLDVLMAELMGGWHLQRARRFDAPCGPFGRDYERIGDRRRRYSSCYRMCVQR